MTENWFEVDYQKSKKKKIINLKNLFDNLWFSLQTTPKPRRLSSSDDVWRWKKSFGKFPATIKNDSWRWLKAEAAKLWKKFLRTSPQPSTWHKFLLRNFPARSTHDHGDDFTATPKTRLSKFFAFWSKVDWSNRCLSRFTSCTWSRNERLARTWRGLTAGSRCGWWRRLLG